MRVVRLGRSGVEVPCRWAVAAGAEPDGHAAEASRLCGLGLPIWVAGSPSVWDGRLAGAWLAAPCGAAVGGCGDEASAYDTLLADFVALLNSLVVDKIGLLSLYAPVALEEDQRAGALRAMAEVREDGAAQALGISGMDSPAALLANWRFDDAFDAVVAPCHVFTDEVVALARERRATLVALDGPCPAADCHAGEGWT